MTLGKQMDYTRFLSDSCLKRKPFMLRELMKIAMESPVPIINLSNGTPNPQTFPVESIAVTLKNGEKVVLEDENIINAMQYTQSDGIPELLNLLRQYQIKLHNPPIKGDWSIVVTAGGQDCISKACETILNPGDSVLCEEYFYPGVISAIQPYNGKQLSVKGDQDGMKPDSLREVLQKWTLEEARLKTNGAPKVLYIVPNGGNPVGTSTSAKRREEIYKIAQEYNLIIFEDDPYYFLQYGQEVAPSFLSLDTDGRVLRFDTFSKVLFPGLRIGYVTGAKPLIYHIVLKMQCTQLHASCLSQVLTCEILKKMTYDGFLQLTKTISLFYKNQRDAMLKCVQKWLTGLAEWESPECGIFLWVRVFGLKDTHHLVMKACASKHISMLPGNTCSMVNNSSPFIRLCYSTCTEEEMDTGISRLADAIREELLLEDTGRLSNKIFEF